MEKKSRKSAKRWDLAGERALIAIWRNKMDELQGCRKNSHILVQIVAELKKQGFSYTVGELKTKMHNMTTRYRKEKQKAATDGLPCEWELFDEMESLLGSYHNEMMQSRYSFAGHFVRQSGNDNSKTTSGFHGYSGDSSQDEDDPIATKSKLTLESPFSENIQSITSAIPPKRSSNHHIQKQQRLPSSLDYAIKVIKKIGSEPTKVTEATNEFTIFGQHVATQLKCLPIEESVLLQQNIQELITAARLKCIHKKDTDHSNFQKSTEFKNNSSFFQNSLDAIFSSESEMQNDE